MEKRPHAWCSDTLQAPTREELPQILTHLRLSGLVNPRVLAVFSHAWCKMPVPRSMYESDSDIEDDVNAQWHDGFQNDESMCKHIGQIDTHMACFIQPDPVQPTLFSCLVYNGSNDESWLFASQFGAECKRQAAEMVTRLAELIQQHQPRLVSTNSPHAHSPRMRQLPEIPPADQPLCVFQILALCKRLSAGSYSIDSLSNALNLQLAFAFRAELGKLIKSATQCPTAAPTVKHVDSTKQPPTKRQFVTSDMHTYHVMHLFRFARSDSAGPAWSQQYKRSIW